jgi:O-antigen ligase
VPFVRDGGLVLLVLPAGTIALTLLARSRDQAAILALLFLAAAGISALLSPEPALAFKGRFGAHSFVIMYLGVFGLWGIGRTLSAKATSVLPLVVVAAMVPNIGLGVVQILLDIDTGPLATFTGRASGFFGNAAYYGSAMSGVAGYVAARALRDRSVVWLPLVVVFSFGTAISGSRVAIAALLLVFSVLAVAQRSRRVVQPSLGVAAGFLAAMLFTRITSSTSAVDRFATDGGDGRVQVWRYGLRAFGERPFLGWGLGNHGVGVRPHFTQAFTRDYAYDDRLISWNDPHNIVVLLLVSTGAIGVVLAAAFLVAGVRNVTDIPLVAMFAVTFLTWMLQPASIESLPVAMLVLGASAKRLDARSPSSDVESAAHRWLRPAATTLGVVLAGYFLVADARLNAALNSGDLAGSVAAARWLWDDPVVTDALADRFTSIAITDPQFSDEAIEWSTRTVEIDGTRPYYWGLLARHQLALGMHDDALVSINRALDLETWNPTAWQLQLAYAIIVGDDQLAERSREVVCKLDLYACTTGSRGSTPDPDP